MSYPPEGQQLPAHMKFLLKFSTSYRVLCHLYACTGTYLFFIPRGARQVSYSFLTAFLFPSVASILTCHARLQEYLAAFICSSNASLHVTARAVDQN